MHNQQFNPKEWEDYLPELTVQLFTQPIFSRYIANYYCQTKKNQKLSSMSMESIKNYIIEEIYIPKKEKYIKDSTRPDKLVPMIPNPTVAMVQRGLNPHFLFYYMQVFILSTYDKESLDILDQVTNEKRLKSHIWENNRVLIQDRSLWNNPQLVVLLINSVNETVNKIGDFIRRVTNLRDRKKGWVQRPTFLQSFEKNALSFLKCLFSFRVTSQIMEIIAEYGINPTVESNPFTEEYDEDIQKWGYFGLFLENLPKIAETLFNPCYNHRDLNVYKTIPIIDPDSNSMKYINLPVPQKRKQLEDNVNARPWQWRTQVNKGTEVVEKEDLNLRKMINFEPTIIDIWKATYGFKGSNPNYSRDQQDIELALRNKTEPSQSKEPPSELQQTKESQSADESAQQRQTQVQFDLRCEAKQKTATDPMQTESSSDQEDPKDNTSKTNVAEGTSSEPETTPKRNSKRRRGRSAQTTKKLPNT